ncbi:MAG: choice-of-anchor Q domain-containing protein [Planctomycetaceae bacterium]
MNRVLLAGRRGLGDRRRRRARRGSAVGAERLEVRALLTAYVVDTTVDESDGNLSAGDLSLREAIEAANASAGADSISFAASVFGTAQTITLSHGEFAITDDLTITGPGRDLLTLDGNNQSRIFRIDDGDDAHEIVVQISGLTITKGFASDGLGTTSDADNGGGIWTSENLEVRNVLLLQNYAKGFGGGIWSDGTTKISNSEIRQNEGSGGVHNRQGVMSLERLLIHGNRGDGIYNTGELRVLESSITGNEGNGLNNFDFAVAEISGCSITNNRASTGAGIYNESVLNIRNSVIANNIATGIGGQGGGGIHNLGRLRVAQLTVTNTSIIGNKARLGGGILNDDSIFNVASAEIRNSIIAGNSLRDAGGNDTGVANDLDGSKAVSGSYNLIGDPASTNGLAHGVDGNIVGQPDSSGGRELLDLATVLGPLGDNGGVTQTFALLPGSVAIDAGDPNFDPNAFDPPLLSDQRGTGFPRINNGNGGFAGRVDIGAFEAPAVPHLVVAENDRSFELAEGNSRSIGVSLNQQPAGNVVVTISEDSSLVAVDLAELTFTPSNWNQVQSFVVSSSTDGVETGDVNLQVSVRVDGSRSDAAFASAGGDISVTFLDAESRLAPPEVTSPTGTITDLRPTITWTSVPGATSYELWLGLIGGSGAIANPTIAGTSFSLTDDLPIGRYRAWVRAFLPNDVQTEWTSRVFQVNAATTLHDLPLQGDSRQPTITWDSVPGAESYRVYIDNSTSGQVVTDTTVVGTSFVPSQALDFGVHRIWVRAIGEGNYAAGWSAVQRYSVGPQPVTAAFATFDERPTFAWTTMPGVDRVRLYVTNGRSAVIDREVTGSEFTPVTALPAGSYRWWVQGIHASDRRGLWSDAGDVFTGGQTGITSPAALVTDGTATITWTSVAGAASYEVYVARTDQPGLVQRVSGIAADSSSPSVSFETQPLQDGDYRVWIRSTNSAGEFGPWSRPQSFTVDAATIADVATPVAPIGVTLDLRPTFNWNVPAAAASSELVLTNGTTTFHPTGLTGTTWIPTADLLSGSWTWWVRIRNASGAAGPWSNTAELNTSGRTQLLTPTGSTSNRTPTFTWATVSGATSYALQVNNITTGENNIIRENALTTTSFTPSTALPTGTYRAWVRALNSTTAGAWSLVLEFEIA